MDISNIIANKLSITQKQVANSLQLLSEGCTIPFIARYRKEKTYNLDEVQIEQIQVLQKEITAFEKRKQFVIAAITEQNCITPEIEKLLYAATTINELEDIYLPFKPKRKTRATTAIENGLEPLANLFILQNSRISTEQIAKFLNASIKTTEAAVQGASDIIAERINENAQVRNVVRNLFLHKATISTKLIKAKEQEAIKYKDYFDISEPILKIKAHRLMAILRAFNEGFVKLNVIPNEEDALYLIERIIIRNNTNTTILKTSVADSFKRLLKPSLENETLEYYRQKANLDSVEVFADNVKQLLMAAPLGKKNVLAIDPGFRTGCKVVCLDGNGNLLNNETIFPFLSKEQAAAARQKIYNKLEVFKIEAIAIGNGTAGRETEEFIKNMKLPNEIIVVMVNENGASIYSGSAEARQEFGDYDITVRSAISIGRRLIDPLAELVKIEPKSIGVGQYQHDVDANLLDEKLTNVVSSCVNAVGINLNTASKELLGYVSGIGPVLAKNIVEFRKENGEFESRQELLDVPRLGQFAYTQCAGFLRIPNSKNILDNTAVHPERYNLVNKIAKDNNQDLQTFVAEKKIETINLSKYVDDEVGLLTLNDVAAELMKPGRDPRKKFTKITFAPNIYKVEHLTQGLILNGVVTNITSFGCFVDIGVHQDGLVHLSNIANEYISNAAEHVKVGQHIKVKVIDIDIPRNRIQLSMKDAVI